jgi:hypothetical protein
MKSFCGSITCRAGALKGYKLVLARPARFALLAAYRLSETGFLAINDVIFALIETLRPLGAVIGTVSHRVAGAYRVVYEIDDVARLVTIVDIRQRWK